MISSQRILLTDVITLIGLYFGSLLGDCLCFGRPFSNYVLSNMYLRALTDNLTHGLISVFATSFLFGWTRYSLLILAFLAGSFVDIDHFIEVRSLSLYRALNDQPQGRGFLHNSLLLLIITFIAVGFEHILWRHHYIYYSIIFFLGWSTHHLRDAQRRGLTFLPFGETSPIDYYLPIMCFILITMKLFYMFFFSRKSSHVDWSLKTLILHNLYLIQFLPDNLKFIGHLRTIWFENCINIHFLLPSIDKQYLKNVVLRHSTCDRVVLTTFLDQFDTLQYLDLGSLQIVRSTSQAKEQLYFSSKLKTCSLNNSFLQFCSFLPSLSLRSLELIDINVDLLLNILTIFQSLQILCLFFTIPNPSLSLIINHLQQRQYSQLLIHLHLSSMNDENLLLSSNISVIPLKNSLSCFCYRNLIS